MQCLFCKLSSIQSRSVEHIIPESMGNVAHVLSVGNVCDACNNYFARKVERPLLESPQFLLMRCGMQVPNKRGLVPVWGAGDGNALPSYRLMGRFLAKVGIEALALKTLGVEGANAELVGLSALDPLRQFARYNQGADWPFTVRTLHPTNAIFADDAEEYEVLHEFNILYTKDEEAFLVLSLFGVEFVLNLGDRNLQGYREWLEAHQYGSPLYPDPRLSAVASA